MNVSTSPLTQEHSETLDAQLSELFNKYVVVGVDNIVSPTHFGEVCRAINRLTYRWGNAQENPFFSEGCQTIGAEATFLKNHTTQEVKELFEQFEEDFTYFDGYSESYELFLNQLLTKLVTYLNSDANVATHTVYDSLESEWDAYLCTACLNLFEEDETGHTPDGQVHCHSCLEDDYRDRETDNDDGD